MKCPSCGKEMRATKRDYRYEEAGLKNVVLRDTTVYECGCGEVLPELPQVNRLHQRIAEDLIGKQSPLTGEEFRFLRKAMGVSAKCWLK
jgi:YgiT-type zinc finger domain-containing protein